jgi:hypothetical protein
VYPAIGGGNDNDRESKQREEIKITTLAKITEGIEELSEVKKITLPLVD